MNKYVKKLIETYANTLGFNPAVLGKGPTKKVSQQVASSAYFPYQPKTDEELKKILRDHINNRNFDFSDITLYFMPKDIVLFNNKVLYEVDLEELKEYAFEYRPKTNQELKNTIYNLIKVKMINDLSCIDVSEVEDFSDAFVEVKQLTNDINISCWDVSNGKKFINMFKNIVGSEYCDLSKWNVSNGKIFKNMFYGCRNFKCDLSGWDVSNGVDFSGMFYSCSSLNCDLSRWNVNNGKNFHKMFCGCTSLNCDLSRWDVSNAVSLSNMFAACSTFNADLSKWNVSNVRSFNTMFLNCTSFNCDLSRWDVSNCIDFNYMFCGCTLLNCDLSKWDVHNGIMFENMFFRCESLKTDIRSWNMKNAKNIYKFINNSPGIISDVQGTDDESKIMYVPANKDDLIEMIDEYINSEMYDLNEIDVSLIKDFSYLFHNLQSIQSIRDSWGDDEDKDFDFRLDISGWNVSNGEDFSHMFDGADFIDFESEGFKNWIVSNGKDFSYMFANHYGTNPPVVFDLSKWDVSNGENFEGMFKNFNQSLGSSLQSWDVSNGKNFESMFSGLRFRNLKSVIAQVENWKINPDANMRFMLRNIYTNVTIEHYPDWYDVETNEPRR